MAESELNSQSAAKSSQPRAARERHLLGRRTSAKLPTVCLRRLESRVASAAEEKFDLPRRQLCLPPRPLLSAGQPTGRLAANRLQSNRWPPSPASSLRGPVNKCVCLRPPQRARIITPPAERQLASPLFNHLSPPAAVAATTSGRLGSRTERAAEWSELISKLPVGRAVISGSAMSETCPPIRRSADRRRLLRAPLDTREPSPGRPLVAAAAPLIVTSICPPPAEAFALKRTHYADRQLGGQFSAKAPSHTLTCCRPRLLFLRLAGRAKLCLCLPLAGLKRRSRLAILAGGHSSSKWREFHFISTHFLPISPSPSSPEGARRAPTMDSE